MLLDGLVVRGGALAPAVLLSAADAVVFQSGTIEGAGGLVLERGARATTSGVDVAAIMLGGRSSLETRGMEVEPSVELGSRWLERAPAPRLAVLRSSTPEVELESSSGTFAWLFASTGLGLGASARIEGVLLLDRLAFSSARARVLVDGRATWTLQLPPGADSFYLQALVVDRGRLALSDVRRLERLR